MDKNQVIEILNSKGYSAHDTNGVLYIDLDDIGPTSINKMRTLLTQLHYYNSWGIKKIQAGALPVTNKTVNLTDEFDFSTEDIDDQEKDNPALEKELVFSENESRSESLDNSGKSIDYEESDLDNNEKSIDYAEDLEFKTDNKPENLETSDDATSKSDEDDDMMFDVNSPFEQVSLFDMMT